MIMIEDRYIKRIDISSNNEDGTLKRLSSDFFHSQKKIHKSYMCMPQIFAASLCLPQVFVAYSVCPSRMSMPQSFDTFLSND